MTSQLTSINPTLFPSSNSSCTHKTTLTRIHRLVKHQTTYLHSMRKSQYTHPLSPPFIPQVISPKLGVCVMSVSALLTHGEKALVDMIASLWRLIQMLPGCMVLTLLTSDFSFLSLMMVSSIRVLSCIGSHAQLNRQIEAPGCGL